jgi:hypothetical protein
MEALEGAGQSDYLTQRETPKDAGLADDMCHPLVGVRGIERPCDEIEGGLFSMSRPSGVVLGL